MCNLSKYVTFPEERQQTVQGGPLRAATVPQPEWADSGDPGWAVQKEGAGP